MTTATTASGMKKSNRMREDDDDDDDDDDDTGCWESLETTSAQPNINTTASTEQQASTNLVIRRRTTSTTATKTTNQDHNRRSSLPQTQQQLQQPYSEATTRTTSNLVDHNFWMKHVGWKFVVHLIRQLLLDVDDWKIRCAFACLVVGGLAQIILWFFYTLLYPHVLVYSTTLILGLGIPIAFFYRPQIEQFIEELSSNADRNMVERILVDHTQIRYLVSMFVVVIPTLLEIRTLQFLTNLVSTHVLTTVSFYAVLGAYVYYYSNNNHHRQQQQEEDGGDDDNNPPTGEATGTWWRTNVGRNLHIQEYSQFEYYVLYGLALLSTLVFDSWRHLPILAARFFLATAVLLYHSSNFDTSEIVQVALRNTVRDALQMANTKLQNDELLQLTMLRWIVEYWSSSSSSSSSPNTDDTTSTNGHDDEATASGSSTRPSTTTTGSSSGRHPRRPTTRPSLSARLGTNRQHDLEWPELWSMLQTTTNQMASEAATLQQPEPQQQAHHHCGEATPTTSSNITAAATTTTRLDDDQQQNSGPVSVPTTTSHDAPSGHPGSSNSTTSSHTHHATSLHSPPGGSSSPPDGGGPLGDSMAGLQAMLASMNIDDRAQPAVAAFRRAVEGLPPTRQNAALLAVIRRFPAMVLLIVYVAVGLVFGMDSSSFLALLLVLPLAFMDIVRLYQWSQSCNKAESNFIVPPWRLHESVDSMTALLMEDTYCVTDRMPTLLVVWANVQSSVSALEAGLVTARCVQTTVVVADFAANMFQLANLGLEVHQHGWMHGMSIVVKELLHLQSTGTDLRSLTHGMATQQHGSYTSAAVSAVRNSQTIHRNVRALAREESATAVVAPLLGVLPLLIGQGWLWGNSDDRRAIQDQRESSSVEITELVDEGDNDEREIVPKTGATDAMHASSTNQKITVHERTGDDSGENDCVSDSFETMEPMDRSRAPSVLPLAATNKDESDQDDNSALSKDGSQHVASNNERAWVSSTINNVSVDNTAEAPDRLFKATEDGSGQHIEKDVLSEEVRSRDKENAELGNEVESSHVANDQASSQGHSSVLSAGILSSECEDESLLTSLEIADSRPETRSAVCIDSQDEQISSVPHRGGASIDTKSNIVSPDDDGDDDDSFEPLARNEVEDLDLELSDDAILSVSSNEASPPTQLHLGGHIVSARLSNDEDNDDDEQDFEPLRGTESIRQMVHKNEELVVAERSSCAEEEDGADDKDLWLKVGGSLAVLGAVVGGVALIAQNGGDENADRKRRNERGAGHSS